MRYWKGILAPARATPTSSPLRFTPLHPAHPGRIQDDSARQVSWLPGRCSVHLPKTSKGLSGFSDFARRLQLRGQPRCQTAFPKPCT